MAKPRDIDGIQPIELAAEEGKPPDSLAMYFPAQGKYLIHEFLSLLTKASRDRSLDDVQVPTPPCLEEASDDEPV